MHPIAAIDDEGPAPSTSGLDLYQWNSPNGLRVAILIEELLAAGCDVQVTTHDMPLKLGLHTQPWFLKINPSGRLPALVDRSLGNRCVFESASIMLYIAKVYDKAFNFHFEDDGEEAEMLSWVFLQTGDVAPLQLEATRCLRSRERNLQSAKYFLAEANRAYGVFETRLASRDFLAGPGRGNFSIADIVTFTWARAVPYTLGYPHWGGAGFPNLEAWVKRIEERDPTRKALKADVYKGLATGEGWEDRSRALRAWVDGA